MQFDPAKTALVAMDFQPTILGTVADTGPLLERVARAVRATRDAGATVATVRVAFEPAELDDFPPHAAMGQRMRSIADKVAASAPGTQVVSEIGADGADIAVRKIRVGPFLTTDLDAQLKSRGVDTIVLAGVQTSGCVLTGVREAHDLDYRVVVLSDGCADPDRAVHDFLMGSIFPKQAEVLATEQYVASIAAK